MVENSHDNFNKSHHKGFFSIFGEAASGEIL